MILKKNLLLQKMDSFHARGRKQTWWNEPIARIFVPKDIVARGEVRGVTPPKNGVMGKVLDPYYFEVHSSASRIFKTQKNTLKWTEIVTVVKPKTEAIKDWLVTLTQDQRRNLRGIIRGDNNRAIICIWRRITDTLGKVREGGLPGNDWSSCIALREPTQASQERAAIPTPVIIKANQPSIDRESKVLTGRSSYPRDNPLAIPRQPPQKTKAAAAPFARVAVSEIPDNSPLPTMDVRSLREWLLELQSYLKHTGGLVDALLSQLPTGENGGPDAENGWSRAPCSQRSHNEGRSQSSVRYSSDPNGQCLVESTHVVNS